MEKIKCLNPNREELTPEKLKELLGHSNYTDEQLQEFVFTIKVFASIIMEYQLKATKEKELKIAA
jgi:hypothetical protein